MKLQFFKNLKRTWPYVKDNKKYIIKFILLSIIEIIISIVAPILSAKIIVDLTNQAFTQLILIAIVIFIIEILRNTVHYFTNNNAFLLYKEGLNKLSVALSKEILRLDEKTLKENGSGVFIQRLTSDIDRISSVFSDTINYVSDLVTNIGIFSAMSIINKYAFLQ